METGLGRPVKPGPGLVFLVAWKKFYTGDQEKIVNFGLSGGPIPGLDFQAPTGPGDFYFVSTHIHDRLKLKKAPGRRSFIGPDKVSGFRCDEVQNPEI